MLRKFQIVRIRLSDGSSGLYLRAADGELPWVAGYDSEESSHIAKPLLLECDDQMSIADLMLLSEEQGRLH